MSTVSRQKKSKKLTISTAFLKKHLSRWPASIKQVLLNQLPIEEYRKTDLTCFNTLVLAEGFPYRAPITPSHRGMSSMFNHRIAARWRILGHYFGYPSCCISNFINDNEDPEKRARGPWIGSGYIACHECAKVLNAYDGHWREHPMFAGRAVNKKAPPIRENQGAEILEAVQHWLGSHPFWNRMNNLK